MTGSRSISAGPFLTLLVLATLSCGSNRQLQSVIVNPPTADARNFANGQVQFTAKGVFSGSQMPVTLTSKDISWCYGGVANAANPTAGVCAGNVAQFVSVDPNGVAQCDSGFHGVGFVLAGVPSGATMPDVGQTLKVFGSATLTCP